MHSAQRRAAYVATLQEFLAADPAAVLGALSGSAEGDVAATQMGAWKQQIDLLQTSLPTGAAGIICFEFVIPRIGKRADNILLIGDQVIVLEFKVGAVGYDSDAKTQAVDYALDLKNFHRGSHEALIVPVLVATKAPPLVSAIGEAFDGVCPVVLANAHTLAAVLRAITAQAHASSLPHVEWLVSGYRPTPTIVDASQVLYRGHSVAEITHSEAGADNLGATTQAVAKAIDGQPHSGTKRNGSGVAKLSHRHHALFEAGQALAKTARSGERTLRVGRIVRRQTHQAPGHQHGRAD